MIQQDPSLRAEQRGLMNLLDPSLTHGDITHNGPDRLFIGVGENGLQYLGDVWQKPNQKLNILDEIVSNPTGTMIVQIEGPNGPDQLMIDNQSGFMMSVQRRVNDQKSLRRLMDGNWQPAIDGSVEIGQKWDEFGVVTAVTTLRSVTYNSDINSLPLPEEGAPVESVYTKISQALSEIQIKAGASTGNLISSINFLRKEIREFNNNEVQSLGRIALGDVPVIQTTEDDSRKYSANEALLAIQGLPLEIVGQDDPLNPDPNKGFPNILYHGTKAEDFVLDDMITHRTAKVGIGANSGAGLYVASKEVSQIFGYGNVVEFIPKEATLIDLGSPKAREPLSQEFKQLYLDDAREGAFNRTLEHFKGEMKPNDLKIIWDHLSLKDGYITKEQVREIALKAKDAKKTESFSAGMRIALEVATQINMMRMIDEEESLSIGELFATYNTVNGESRFDSSIAFSLNPLIDFLTSNGVDGAKTAQLFDSVNGKEQAVVFWKLDKVGDKKTWEKRLKA